LQLRTGKYAVFCQALCNKHVCPMGAGRVDREGWWRGEQGDGRGNGNAAASGSECPLFRWHLPFNS